jgi:uncharacterized protein
MIEWVVEASTFCNLRCAYCYQWDGLADRTRMPLDLWAKVFAAACDEHVARARRLGRAQHTQIIWHGGEPLTLPLDYLRRTLELKDEIVGAAGIPSDEITAAMQTNLYAVSDEALELLRHHRVGFGVSFDLVRGVRLNRLGVTTEDRVLANLDRVHEAGLTCGAITVLAKHTCAMVTDVYDFWAARRMPFRVLPLFAGPAGRPEERFAASEDELVAALCRLFDHRLRDPSPLPVAPLDDWTANVVRHLLGRRTQPYDRRRWGDSVIVVRPDGRLFQVAETGDDRCALGDLAHHTMAEVRAGAAYAASLDRSDDVTRRRCADCAYYGACDGWPAHTAAVEQPAVGRCHVAYRVQLHIESRLRQAGLGASVLRAAVDQAGRELELAVDAAHV